MTPNPRRDWVHWGAGDPNVNKLREKTRGRGMATPSCRRVRIVLRVGAARCVSFASRAGFARSVLTLNRRLFRAQDAAGHESTASRLDTLTASAPGLHLHNQKSTVKRRPTAFSSTVAAVCPLSGSQSEGRVACHASDFRRHPNRQCSTVLHPCHLEGF
jgi:hypothetical protein